MNLVKNNKDIRIIYFDFLRIFATFAVIVIHVCAQNWYYLEFNTFEWNIFNLYHGLSQWAVPIFIMISGSLFLNKDYSIKTIYKHNIFKIMTAFFFWSVFYAINDLVFRNYSIIEFINSICTGHYHMWFLFMIVGLYMIVPILKKITESTLLVKYLLILLFISTFLLPQVLSIISLIFGDSIIILDTIIENISFIFPLGYIGYFLGGYYLDKIEINKKWRRNIYILGIIGFILTVLLTSIFSILKRESITVFFDYLSINVMFSSVAVFVFAKYHLNNFKLSNKTEQFVSKLSNYSFGIYMIHPFVIFFICYFFGYDILSLNSFIYIPIISFVVFIISFITSKILNSIPVLRKYIV